MLVAGLVFVALAPRVLGWHLVVVAGGSMEPTIPFGSVAIIRDTDPAKVKPGDIVMYNDPRTMKVVTHRVTAVSEDGTALTTKGDANNSADEGTLPRSAIRGEYLLSVPMVGRFVHWMGTREGFLAVILVPGLTIIAIELASIARELRRSLANRSTAVPEPSREP